MNRRNLLSYGPLASLAAFLGLAAPAKAKYVAPLTTAELPEWYVKEMCGVLACYLGQAVRKDTLLHLKAALYDKAADWLGSTGVLPRDINILAGPCHTYGSTEDHAFGRIVVEFSFVGVQDWPSTRAKTVTWTLEAKR